MNNIWVMTIWSEWDDNEGEKLLGVYDDFDKAADVALRMIKELEEDAFVHTEDKTSVETFFTDGLARYTIMCQHGEQEPYADVVIQLARREINTVIH